MNRENVGVFRIGDRVVGPGHPCLIIGEVAQSHDGSLGTAHAFIDAIARAGADAVKFQTHIADAESTPAEPWRVKFSPQDETRYDYWRRMEFTADQWRGLREHAETLGLIFLSSPFSPEAVDLLVEIGVKAWKIASGEVGNAPLLDHILQSRLPVILSSGMSASVELDGAVTQVANAGVPFATLQCTSAYPCPPEKIGLNVMQDFRERYACPVGLSDHSGTIYASLSAVTLGASIVEVHVAFSREMFGPDVPSSITTDELAQMVEGVRFTERMLANPVKKDGVAAELAPLRQIFTKSLVSRMDLEAGTLLKAEHLAAKKPGTGIPAARLDDLIGRRTTRRILRNQLLREEDFE